MFGTKKLLFEANGTNIFTKNKNVELKGKLMFDYTDNKGLYNIKNIDLDDIEEPTHNIILKKKDDDHKLKIIDDDLETYDEMNLTFIDDDLRGTNLSDKIPQAMNETFIKPDNKGKPTVLPENIQGYSYLYDNEESNEHDTDHNSNENSFSLEKIQLANEIIQKLHNDFPEIIEALNRDELEEHLISETFNQPEQDKEKNIMTAFINYLFFLKQEQNKFLYDLQRVLDNPDAYLEEKENAKIQINSINNFLDKIYKTESKIKKNILNKVINITLELSKQVEGVHLLEDFEDFLNSIENRLLVYYGELQFAVDDNELEKYLKEIFSEYFITSIYFAMNYQKEIEQQYYKEKKQDNKDLLKEQLEDNELFLKILKKNEEKFSQK